MDVILIRHTRVDVPKGTCYGQTDVPVAATFEEEAARTKASLAQYGVFDKIYTSPLTRARMLAAYCGYPDAETDERLMELNMGQWEMQRYDNISDPYLQEWFADYLHLPTQGGESFQDQYRRMCRFLDDLRQQPYCRVAVFAHAGILASAGIYGGLYTEATAWDNLTDYGGIIKITI